MSSFVIDVKYVIVGACNCMLYSLMDRLKVIAAELAYWCLEPLQVVIGTEVAAPGMTYWN